jgi:hypothetical protein
MVRGLLPGGISRFGDGRCVAAYAQRSPRQDCGRPRSRSPDRGTPLPAQCALPVLPLSADDDRGLPVHDRGPDRLCAVGLGVLTGETSPGMVDRVIGLAGCREKRRRLLPARTVVYFVLGLCLFSGADSMGPPGYRSVMRWLTNGLRHLDGMVLSASSALARARQRLGARPLELLFGLRRGPLAAAGAPGAFAIDETGQAQLPPSWHSASALTRLTCHAATSAGPAAAAADGAETAALPSATATCSARYFVSGGLTLTAWEGGRGYSLVDLEEDLHASSF